MKVEKKANIAISVSVLSVSFAAIFIVSIDAPALSISFYRLLFTTLIISPYVLFYKKRRNELSSLSRKNIILMIGIGIILALHFAFWITSLKLTSVASSVILVTAHPLLVGPVSHFFLKEKLSFVNYIGIILSVFGVIILVYGNYGFALGIDTLQGNILAILGGVAAGFYILGGRKLRKTVSIGSYVIVVYSVGTIVLFCICILFNAPLIKISLFDLGVIILMAIVAGIFGHTLYNWSLQHIRASVASVVLLGEPIGSSILAFLLPWIQQTPSYFTIVGGGVILSGIYLTSRKIYENKIS